jgi:hypothetical protein
MPTNNPPETGDANVVTLPETPETEQRDGKPSPLRLLVSRFADHRASRAADAETAAEQRRLLKLREQQETARQQETASRTAASRRKAQAVRQETGAETEIAPVPLRMRIAGAWADRSIGSLQLAAPLIVSGWFTMDVGMDDPLNMAMPVALFFTLSLEGSLWYLNRLREQFRLEGDSTFSLTAAIFGIITLIAALIGGHAIWKAAGSQAINIDLPGTENTVPLEDVVPALAVALMSAIGTFVWAKKATFKHRVKLREQMLIDPRAPKFAAASWIWCFPTTFFSYHHAVKYRIQSPILAVEDWRLWKLSGRPAVWPLVETVEAELAETSQPQRLKPVPSRVVAETVRPALSSPERPALPSAETDAETPIVSGVSVSETAGDLVETVGRLHRDEGLSYKEIGERLHMSKAHAGRLGSSFYKRLAGDGETGESVAAAV